MTTKVGQQLIDDIAKLELPERPRMAERPSEKAPDPGETWLRALRTHITAAVALIEAEAQEPARAFGDWLADELRLTEAGRQPRYRAAKIGIRTANAKWRADVAPKLTKPLDKMAR